MIERTENVVVESVGYIQKTIVEVVSMRDQFAMAALSALLSGRANGERTHWAKVAYEIADDMLDARKEKK